MHEHIKTANDQLADAILGLDGAQIRPKEALQLLNDYLGQRINEILNLKQGRGFSFFYSEEIDLLKQATQDLRDRNMTALAHFCLDRRDMYQSLASPRLDDIDSKKFETWNHLLSVFQ